MIKTLLMVTLVSIVMFYMARPILSQEIDPYSLEVLEDVAISPSSKFNIYVEAPDEALFEEADSPAIEYDKDRYKIPDFIAACAMKQIWICLNVVFENMKDEMMPIIDECCREILKIGKDCHFRLVEGWSAMYVYGNSIASKDIPYSKQSWNECVRRVGSKFGAPVSFEQ
ncbi:unnamed protein product [Arabidopsis thaliana]|uniref:Prolamin-like domain-containing protein n=1 Tax=Arabidopsis thaliana TaxID=3702 RepID=A0A654EGA9_ARATH|nr:unnamed protein product [Arabidopsis thaliana]